MATPRRFIARNGIDNNNHSLTNVGAAGSTLALSGGHAVTITTSGTSNITIPTSGTVITTGSAGGITNSMLVNSTISGVSLGSNLNTLTLGTSGTGLSGSATYNGSGAVTFTVASNATSANTASAIVARDASGNFSAGTITAALSGNASTATASTTQAHSDTSTNIATTAWVRNILGARTTSGVTDWNDVSNTRPGTGYTLLLGTASNGMGGGNYYHPFNLEYSSNDGTGNVTQLAVAYGSPGNEIYMRGRYAGSWSSWIRLLNSNNYNDYSPTLTGTGASGTWNINVTGNANNITQYTVNQNLGTSNAPSWQYIGVNPTGTSNNGYGISLYGGAQSTITYGLMFQGTGTYGTHGNVTGDWATYFLMNNDSTRGWIFRTQGTANVASISAGGVAQFDSVRIYDSSARLYYSSGRLTVRSESTDDVANFAGYGLYLPRTGQTAGLYVESPIEARSSIRMGSGAGNGTISYGADTAATANRLVQRDSSGNITVAATYSTIFYDSNNSGYYSDPASTSLLYTLGVLNYQYISGQTPNGQSFYQWEGATYRNPGDHTPSLLIRADNSSTGINGFRPALALYNNNGADQTTVGLSFVSAEGATGAGNAVALAGIIAKKEAAGTVGGWTTGSLNFFVKDYATRRDAMSISYLGFVQSDYSFRSPIFYDSNNTAYYVDPASTSVFNSVYLANGNTKIDVHNTGQNTKWRTVAGSSDVGISFYDANDRWTMQLYANYGDGYGFLNSNWGGWDIKKAVGGVMYLNNNTTYYLNPPSTSNFNALITYSYQGNGNVGGTGSASWHPSGIYSAGYNWLYGGISGGGSAGTNFSSLSASIFYDYDDTNYYINAHGTSVMNAVNYWGVQFWNGDGVYARGTNSYGYRFNNYENTINAFVINNSGDTTSYASSRAPIFYDSNNTAYYVDAASTSFVNALRVNAGIGTNSIGGSSPNDVTRVQFPGGGAFSSDGSTGAIKIRLPFRNNGTMWALKVRIYNYSNNTIGEYHIGAYSYNNGGYNAAASYQGSSNLGARTVRIGNDGTYDCIWIGETNTGWSYPVVSVTEVMAGFRGGSFSNFNSGWDVSVVGSFGTVESTITPSITTSNLTSENALYTPIVYDSNDTAYYINPNSTSVTRQINIVNGNDSVIYAGPNSSWGAYLYVGSGTSKVGSATAQVIATDGNLHIDSGTSNILYLQYYTGQPIYAYGNLTLMGSNALYAPIFYDTNNTGYYSDPASTSRLNVIYCGDVYNDLGGWFRNYGATGIYNQSYGNHFYSDETSYWNLSLGGNSYGGLRIRQSHGGTVLGYVYADTSNNIGFLNNSGNWRARVVGADYFLVEGSSIRGLLFYDSNDTSYYVDPHSVSYQRSLYLGAHDSGTAEFRFGEDSSGWYGDRWYWDSLYTVYRYSRYAGTDSLIHYHDTRDTSRITYGRNIVFDDYGKGIVGTYASTRLQLVFAMGDAYKIATDGTATNNMYGIAWSHPNAGSLGGANNLADHGLLIINNGSFRAAISNRIVASEEVRGTLFRDYNDTGYYVDPASTSNVNLINSVNLTASGASYFYGNAYAPTFYDSVDSAYYVNPNAGSYLYGLSLSGNSYFVPNNWIQFNSSYGVYWPNHYGAHLYANTGSSYTQIRIDGNKGGYGGIWDSYSAVHGIMYDSSGNGGVYREANGLWYFYYHVGNGCMGIGTSTTNSTYGIYAVKGGYFDGRVDGTIFYDANNTGYYADPASTSRFNQIITDYLYGNVETATSNNSSTSYSVAAIELRESQYGGSSSYLAPRLAFHWGGVVASQISIESSGRISIINNPGSAYESLVGSIIYGDSSVRGPIFYDTNNTAYYVDPASGTNLAGIFMNTGEIRATSNITAYYSSDRRLKENVVSISNALDKINKISGVEFDWTDEYIEAHGGEDGYFIRRHDIGVIAQEIQEVLPDVVAERMDGYLAVRYEKIVPLLIEAIKQQQQQIEQLKTQITGVM